MNLLDKIKDRWGITSNFQVLIIFIVFGITGSSALYVKNFIFNLIGINSETPIYYVVPLYILTILPAYQILLLFWGTIFGQYKFFINFQKKTFSRFNRSKKTTN